MLFTVNCCDWWTITLCGQETYKDEFNGQLHLFSQFSLWKHFKLFYSRQSEWNACEPNLIATWVDGRPITVAKRREKRWWQLDHQFALTLWTLFHFWFATHTGSALIPWSKCFPLNTRILHSHHKQSLSFFRLLFNGSKVFNWKWSIRKTDRNHRWIFSRKMWLREREREREKLLLNRGISQPNKHLIN